MKKKTLTLLFTTGCSLLLISVHADTVWRNHGAGAVYGDDNNHACLYIAGDMQFEGDAWNVPSLKIESGRVKLTGNLLNDVSKGPSGGNLFISASAGNDGILEFCGSAAQQITTSGTGNTTIPSKLHNYINFPNLVINNNKHVTLDARLAAKTNDIILTKGWLILDSQLAKQGTDGGVEVNEGQESVLSHLLVEGNIDYGHNEWQGKAAADRGFIQVNLKIPGEGDQHAKSIVGFGIPFRQMYNDYFMYNTLLAPAAGYTDGTGFLANPPLVDPKTQMTAGKGYVVGIDLRGTDPAGYEELEGYEGIISFSQRATDGYRFNRHAFSEYAPDNQLFGSDPSVAAYQNEVLNTSDLTIALEPGYNYLSNPYTCPLNIDKLLGNNEAQSTWGIHADALSAQPQIRNQVWVLAPNSVAEPTQEARTSKYTYNYQVAMRTGGTYIDNDNVAGVTAIAPLQMFLVRAYSTASTITIPESERVMGTSRFLRSGAVAENRRDDFIIEFRDMQTNTTDRASIVLRTREELNSNTNYLNIERLESTNGTRSLLNEGGINADFEQSLASQIYTKDDEGKALTVQFLPLETERVILYHIPSSQAQPLNILGLRIDTKENVTRMWLEDHKYNTEVEITPEMLYETYSEPTDSHERFAIRFSTESTSMENIQSSTSHIYAYSSNRTIYAEGFEQSDLGCSIDLYEINGRLVARKTVDGSKILLMEECTPGIYIVKAGVKDSQPRSIKLIVR